MFVCLFSSTSWACKTAPTNTKPNTNEYEPKALWPKCETTEPNPCDDSRLHADCLALATGFPSVCQLKGSGAEKPARAGWHSHTGSGSSRGGVPCRFLAARCQRHLHRSQGQSQRQPLCRLPRKLTTALDYVAQDGKGDGGLAWTINANALLSPSFIGLTTQQQGRTDGLWTWGQWWTLEQTCTSSFRGFVYRRPYHCGALSRTTGL